ncbi:MAG: transposase [Candidatus Limisoma sp.]
MSQVSALFHVVINTHNRLQTIPLESRRIIYNHIYELLTNHKCKLLRMNGTTNHIHMLIDLHTSVALSALIGEIKRETSLWIKHSGLAPQFRGWGREYYAFSLSKDSKNNVIEYIKNQLEHHKFVSFEDEMARMCNNMGAEFYET